MSMCTVLFCAAFYVYAVAVTISVYVVAVGVTALVYIAAVIQGPEMYFINRSLNNPINSTIFSLINY